MQTLTKAVPHDFWTRGVQSVRKLDDLIAQIGSLDLEAWAEQVLDWLVPQIDALSAAFYYFNGDALQCLGSYALDLDQLKNTFSLGEGWVGQAAQSRRELYIEQPHGAMGCSEGLIRVQPQALLCFPLLFNQNLMGVLELTWAHVPGLAQRERLGHLAESLSAALYNAVSQQRITLLYQEAQDKSAQLQEKENDLRQYIAELEEAQNQMRVLQDNLELTVRQRTAELETALEELKEAQQQVIQSEKLASLGQLVAGVAHEINTPIGIAVTAASFLETTTQGLEELFASGKMKRSDFEEYLDQARESSLLILKNLERAAQLIQSFKKVAVNQSAENIYPFNLNDYLHEIMTSLGPQLRKTRIEYAIECPEQLTVTSAPSAISQIVINLVMNSLTHAYEPNEKGQLSLTVKDLGDKVELRYSDNGKGIPQEIIDKIFDPFFTTKRGSGGSGLGLNIVHNLTTSMLKGTVRCTSVVGKGTSFFVVFPKSLV